VGGANLSTIGGEEIGDTEFSSRSGLLIGGQLGIHANSGFGVLIQALYTQRGADFGEGGSEDGRIKLDYVQIPVLAQMQFPSAGVTPYLFAGPSLSFKAGCEAEDLDSGETIDCDDPEFDLDQRSTDFSIIGGAGLRIGAFDFAIRYDYGLAKIEQGSEADNLKNRAVTLTAALAVRLPR